ncbi:HVO_0234 family beta-propeller protein [Salinirubrum litoreum]|uniref:HVO-0234-like beta-propeller domain-containing protein n=1 Tax=Salinirubrum litoreum TaxID=1126234 RepID=A0ABD5R798_9EURY|nr:hypothetical protein [Salinirubrum litoreum]
MPTIEEKRVYTESAGTVELAVATDLGLVVVDVSDDFVGEFGIALREPCRDVTSVDGALAVATDEDVLVAPPESETFAPTAFGPAASVAADDGDLLALSPDGTVGRLADLHEVLATGEETGGDTEDAEDGEEASLGAPDHEGWRELGQVDGGRRLDGNLLAAEGGVYRVGDDLVHAGLDDVRDVASAGVPRCATGAGLYRLGNGWLDDLSGDFRLVAGSVDGRANAVGVVDDGGSTEATAGEERLFAVDDGEWRAVESPVPEAVAAVAHGEAATYVVSESGTLAVDAGDGWRTQTLGVRGVAALTVR